MSGVVWSNYVKQNQVSRTMPFELVPTEETKKTIDDLKLIEQDKKVEKKKDDLKPVIDAWVRSIISKSLKDLDFDFETLVSEDDDERKEAEKALDAEIANAVNRNLPACFEDKKTKKKNASKIFSDKFIQTALREFVLTQNEFPKEDAISNIDDVKGLYSVFKSFLISRVTALNTWMPERVKENFSIYMDNASAIKPFIEDHEEEVRNSFPEIMEFTTPNGYKNAISPEGIDAYNLILSGIVKETGTEKKGIIQTITEINSGNRANKTYSGRFYRKPKKLYKQVLMPQAKAFTIDIVESDDKAREVLKSACSDGNTAIKAMENILAGSDGTDVVVCGNNLHQLSFLLWEDHAMLPIQAEERYKKKLKEEFEKIGRPTKKQIKQFEADLSNANEGVRKQTYTFSEIAEMTGQKTEALYKEYVDAYKAASKEAIEKSSFLTNGSFDNKEVKGNKYAVDKIREITESWTDARSIARIINDKGSEKADAVFYNEYADAYSAMQVTAKAERLVRAYITRKIGETEGKSPMSLR